MDDPSDVVAAKLGMTEYSRISSRYLAELLDQQYDLGKPVHCRLLQPERAVYDVRFAGGAKAILRVHERALHWLPKGTDVGYQYEWASFLSRKGIPTSAPIGRRNGKLFGMLEAAEGLRCFGLWSYAEGDDGLNVLRAGVLGKTLATIHVASDSFRASARGPRFDLETLLHMPRQWLMIFFSSSRHEDMEFLSSVCESLDKRLGDLPTAASSFGPIWGDANGSNQHFKDDDELTIFDHELSGHGWRIYDLAIFRWARDRDMNDSKGLWQSFLQGYESVRPLAQDESQLIPYLVALRHIWVLGSTVADHLELPEMAPVFLTTPPRWDRAFETLRSLAAGLNLRD